MIFIGLKRLKFLLKSRNQYGVHSPFVYDLVTKCFYQKTSKKIWKLYLETTKKSVFISTSSKRKLKLLLRFIDYFQFKNNIKIEKHNTQESSVLKAEIFSDFSEINHKENYDLIYIDREIYLETSKKNIDAFFDVLPLESTLIFDAIYINNETQEFWEALKKHPKITVTVDVFYLGIAFLRSVQVEEHFTIRV